MTFGAEALIEEAFAVLEEGGLVCFPDLCHHSRGLGPAEREVSAYFSAKC